MRAVRIILKILLGIVAAAAILAAVLTIAEYRPLEREDVPVIGSGNAEVHAGDELTLLSWNTGYGALGSNADFFMDGGTMVMTADRERMDANMLAMTKAAAELNADAVFLQ